MSQTLLNPLHTNKCKIKQKTKNGEPIVVINHLNDERDITNMVDELLSKNLEFPDDSSIFVVVPSDDYEAAHSSDGHNSTICIQMSENRTQWKCVQGNPMELDMTQRRISTTSHGVKISAKGKQFCMEALPTSILSYHNKETMFNYIKEIPRDPKRKQKTKNKLCQITTPNEEVQIVEQTCVVSTDTTSDRPCCCPPKEYTNDYGTSDYGINDTYVTNVLSKQITPLLVKQDINYDLTRESGMCIDSPASFMSLNLAPISVTPRGIPPCTRPSGGQRPINTPCQDSSPPQISPCQCSPERFREILEQAVKARKGSNLKSIGIGETAIPHVPPPASVPTPASNKLSLKGEKLKCAPCSHPTYLDECDCSGSKKPIKIKKPPCPCEQQNLPQSRMEPDLPYPTLQPDIKTLGQVTPVRQMGQTHLIGPAGESMVETGETYTQAGNRQTRFSSTIGTSTDRKTNCICKDKHGKKRKKVICACPEPEHEPKLEPEAEPLPLPYWVNAKQVFEWTSQASEIMKLNSELTQRVSGFKMNKKKQPPAPFKSKEEFTLDDAIRYYAIVKPELFRDIFVEQQLIRDHHQRHELTTKQTGKTDTTNVKCACPAEPPSYLTTSDIPSDPTQSETAQSELVQSETGDDEGQFRGLKFRMGGKGSQSPGLTGVCCFDLLQESFTTW